MPVPLVSSPLHRIPILWSLYRPLLRLSATNIDLRNHIKRTFRRDRHIASLQRIEERIKKGHTMHDELVRLASGSPPPTLVRKYTTLAAHLANISYNRVPPVAPPTPARPRLTPGIIFSTPYNPPLPRYKPQPEHISMLIFRRRAAIQRRWDRFAVTKERVDEAREEISFLRRMGVKASGAEQWDGSLERGHLDEMKVSFEREKKRNEMTASKEMMADARAARIRREIYRKRRSEEGKTRRSDHG